MSNRDQTQADLLDEFRQSRDGTPPAGLDSGIAAMAVMLEERLSPPAPSARFMQTLGRRLDAESSPASNHRPAGVLPLLPDQTIPPSPPDNDWQRESGDEPRRPWLFEVSRIAAAGLAIALVGTLLVLLFRDAEEAAAPGAGETSPHPGEILVSWDPNGGKDYKLFMVDISSGELRKVTSGPAEADGVAERSPAWSPDGQQVAFLQGTENESNLYIINADGSNLFNISGAAGIGQVSDFSWSPDGTQIAVTADVPGAANIYTVNVDGSNLHQLTADGEAGWGAMWSPDGTQIAFIKLNGMRSQVQIIDADGNNVHSLNIDTGVDHLAWSPDGTQLAFTGGRYIKSVYVVNADGSQPRQFTDQQTTASVQPEWSPDGRSIAFIAYDDGGSVSGTFITNLAGSEWRQLTPIRGFHEWSPDGSQLAIVTSGIDRSGAPTFRSTMYIIDADGSGLQPLLQDASLSAEEPVWRPPVTGEELPAPVLPTPTTIPTTETSTGRLYVVTSNGVTVVDPATNDEVYSIDAGFSPDAALSPDGSRLYVLGAGGIDDLVAFDAANGDEIWRTTVEDRISWIGGQGPSTLAISPDGSRIYMASSNGPDVQRIQILDAATGERIDETEPIIGYCPAMMYPSRDGSSLFLVCQRSGVIHDVNLDTLALAGNGEFPGANVGAARSPDGSYLYIVTAVNGRYQVSLIRAADDSEGGVLERRAGVLQLGREEQPPLLGEMVALSPDGARLYVAIGAGYNADDASPRDVREITVFDTTSWEEIDRITLDVPLKGGAFTMSPDGRYIYTSERLQSESDGKLIKIDVESNEVSTVLVRNAEILRVLTTPENVSPSPPPGPETIPTPEKVPPFSGVPIELPFNLATRNHTQERVILIGPDGPPLVSQEEAMQTIAQDFPWGLGGEWEGKTVTIDAWYGIGTIGSEIQERAMWLIDYGNVQGIIGAGCPGCPPPPVYNHNAYAIDAQTGELIWWGSYSDENTTSLEPPPARLSYADQMQVQESRSYCWTASDESGCTEGDGPPPPEPALVAPPGANLSFAVDEIETFEIVGARSHSLVTDTERATDELTYSGLTVDLPFDQSASHSQFVVTLAEGVYVFSIQIEVELAGDRRLNATYDFRVHVTHAASTSPGDEITTSELAEFDGFPVWSLGETFGEFALDGIVEHHHDTSGDNVSIEFTYIAEDGRTNVGITITSQEPLSETELRARQGLGEPVVVKGEDGWLTPVDDNATIIEVALGDGHLSVFATDRETALAAAEAVQQVNAPAFPEAEVFATEPPPLTTWETREGESPLATWDPNDRDAYPAAASGQGMLDISADCARLMLSNQKVILLVWPEPTSWNPSSQTIEFISVDGERIELRDGDQIIAGGLTATTPGGTRFVVPPQPSCEADELFIAHGIQLITD